MSEKTLWVLVTVSREWPWESRGLIAEVLGKHVAWARDRGFTRWVLMHGAYGLKTGGGYKHDPPRSDSIAHAFWVGEWGFPDEPHPAQWETYGRASGPIRNADMVQRVIRRVLEYPDDVVRCEAFIAGGSAGASGCADMAERAGIKTRRHSPVKPPAPRKLLRGARRPVLSLQLPAVDPMVRQSPSEVPGPCGRCGRVSYLSTDDVLYQGDGICVFWDATAEQWRFGCGFDRPLVRPAVESVS